MTNISDVVLTPLKIILNEKGDIYHALKNNEMQFKGFGEAYFSTVKSGIVKGWKKHIRMTLNLVVPIGSIKIVMYDDRIGSTSKGMIDVIQLSPENYYRLTIPPQIWFSFAGIGQGTNLMLNVADIPHDPDEQINLDIFDKSIPYKWSEAK